MSERRKRFFELLASMDQQVEEMDAIASHVWDESAMRELASIASSLETLRGIAGRYFDPAVPPPEDEDPDPWKMRRPC